MTVTASNKFSVAVDSTAFGALTGTVRCYSTQEQSNISICDNIFRGPLVANTAFIQNRGNYTQRNIRYNNNVFDNLSGAVVGGTFAINNAVQTPTGGQTINFQCCGNSATGFYDQAVFRLGNIGSGVALGNTINASAQRGFRIGTTTDLKLQDNFIAGCTYGLVFNDGVLTGVEARYNMVKLPAANNVAGIYIESQSAPLTNFLLYRNTIEGQGTGPTNVYGIQDASNGNGSTNLVEYIENRFALIDTSTGTGSTYYKTLPAHALVVEAATPSAPTPVTNPVLTTPDARGKREIVLAYTSPVTVTDFLNGSPNQELAVMFANSNATIQRNAGLLIAPTGAVPDFAGTADDVLNLKYSSTDGGATWKWRERSRSVN